MRPGIGAAAAFAMAWLLPASAVAALRLPHVLSDHAVLQRGKAIHVWGWATPDVAVTVTLHRQRSTVVADRLGRWDAWLAPEAAGGPYVLRIGGDGGEIALQDVMLGDVWLASGQSNMEMPLEGFAPASHVEGGAAAIAAARNPRIRLLRVEKRGSPLPQEDVDQSWTESTPETAARFSAIGWFFARAIAAHEKVAVGVILSAWGGTPADSWVSMRSFGSDPALLPAFAARARFEEDHDAKTARLAAEAREDAEATARGLPAPKHDWHPPEEAYRPAALYNGMIAPLTGYGVKGVIWYQGETNSAPGRAPFYEALFKGLIADWRHQFGQGRLPFLFAQISSFDSPGEQWGLVRDAQRRALDLAGTAMAVTTDLGGPADVHPADKRTVADRLALAARAVAYSEKVAYASPLFRQVTGAAGGLRVWFDHADGLAVRGGALAGFEIAGADRRFVPAAARLDGSTVLVTGPVPAPRFVRYHWNNVTRGGLYNAAGLPASTFTSEE